MPETAENVAEDYKVSRADQDAFAVRSQARASAAQAESSRRLYRDHAGHHSQRKGDPIIVDKDEHPRATTIETLAKPFVKAGGTITAETLRAVMTAPRLW